MSRWTASPKQRLAAPCMGYRLGAECWVLGRAPLGRRRGPRLPFQECALPLPPPQVGQAPLGLPF